ncbi:MAG: hypothetical protein PHY02_06580 [Phycisphaerae bacterium]|nr:hypothetical protein [Phycisphaerae bacterium]
MNHILTQLILAARRNNDGDTGWTQILVFVALAIFYSLGSIVKAKSNKTAPKGKEPLKPGRKPPEIDLRMLKQLFGYPEPENDEEPAASSQPSQQVVVEPTPLPPRPTHRKIIRPTAELAPAAAAVESILDKKPSDKTVRTETSQTKYLSGIPSSGMAYAISSDYRDPERLRRAILHYEILGKPLSLREPF